MNGDQSQQPQDKVFMRPNTKDAQWEQVSYKWPAAIIALGHSYDLKRVMPDGKEEERPKVPNVIAKPQPASANVNPNVEFELWREANGADDNVELQRNAFLGGWFQRQAGAR